jgi:murein DD-endopeptidase MepM/ murein hydrolase activator NlpD
VQAALVLSASLTTMALSGLPAVAEDPEPTPDPPTTTAPEPVPEPPTTTVPEPPTTTEPLPDTTTTVPPSDTTTTVPPPDTTAPATADLPVPGALDPGETLECSPEFASLSGSQRGLVRDLQIATDAYALRRFPLVGLTHQLEATKGVLSLARAIEDVAVMRQLLGVADAVGSPDGVPPPSAGPERDEWLDDYRELKRELVAERREAKYVRLQAKAEVTAASERLAAQQQLVAEASDARAAAESAIEDALGPSAVRARPDGITATLARAQDGQPDPFVVGGIGRALFDAELSSPFGLRNDPLCGGAGFHAGLDLAAASGTEIHAAAGGVVVTAGDCDGYGYCVVVDHGARLATLYGHQSSVLVRVGEEVDAGEIIGLVGSTGRSTGPHLHFEVRLRGIAIDPLLALLPD